MGMTYRTFLAGSRRQNKSSMVVLSDLAKANDALVANLDEHA
jgi:hypothetical protein